MRIRVKLTLLLLVFALAPMATLETIDAITFRRLSRRVEEQVSANIARRVEQELAVHVRRTGEQMGSIRQRVMTIARTQAAIFAEALAEAEPPGAAAPPDAERLVHRTGDFDALAPGEIPPGLREQAGWPRGPIAPPVVDDRKPVLVPGDEPLSPATIARLADATDELEALSRGVRTNVRSQFLGLTTGAHLAFPGKGGYDGYDPRTRDWYRAAVDADDVVWVGPYLDAITGEPRLTASAPVRAPEGTLLGVTGVDFALRRALDLLELPGDLSLGSTAWVLALDAPDVPGGDEDRAGPAGTRVLLSTATNPGAEPELRPGDPGVFTRITEDLRSGRGGARSMTFAGEPSIWAYGPIAPEIGLVMVVPEYNIDSLVGGVRADLRSIASESSRSLIAVSVLVVALCFLGAYLLGRTVSRPIRRLADAAQAIREGDLTARVQIRSRGDEVGKLARAFNEMVPALADRMRLRESVALANQLQQGLLPQRAPEIPGFDVFGIAVYCDETGGDYFDFLEPIDMGPGRYGLALGDVTGHGIPAALIMTSARALLQSHARDLVDPGAILTRMNATIAREATHGRFMTFALMVLDSERRTLEVANAGHDPALLLRARDASFEELPMGGLPLGVTPDETYETVRADLPGAGDVLIVGTDGIWETRNAHGALYGKQRLREVVRAHATEPAEAIGRAILDDLKVFRGNAPVLDDITFIIAKATA